MHLFLAMAVFVLMQIVQQFPDAQTLLISTQQTERPMIVTP